ncbi:MAG: dTDP-4-dehydrorhamnose 3,5-epimerase [Crocinitomicaceae bacterium]|nr:dTDP-4-dehydrorhamnose 3,5-epimerase [Crocinitomicaceae bacterium]
MKFTESHLKGAFIIELEPMIDDRGSFARAFCANEFKEHGLNTVMPQSNLSVSTKKYTLRGMHYQINGAEEAKLIRCQKGAILDTIIDIRKDSETYCQHLQIELTDKNNTMLYVPEGFAHGFITLEDNCEVFYQVSEFYTPNKEKGIRWNDPLFNIQWPTDNPVLSDKDRKHPDFIK